MEVVNNLNELVDYAFINQNRIPHWESQLRFELARMTAGEIAMIEFGQQNQTIKDVFTRIRIRKATTVPETTYSVDLVHVFYGDQKPATYYTDNTIEQLVQFVMSEVMHWTQARCRIGQKFAEDPNKDLSFYGLQIDYTTVINI